MKQPWAWISWLVATLVGLTITRNPLYLILILLCISFVAISVKSSTSDSSRLFPFWKLAGWIIGLATIFNALTSHYGQTVLFTIPGNIPLLSGKVTAEALVYGATNGLVLTGMLASFSVINLALPVRELIGLIPRAFFPLAVVTSIAITYLPTTFRQYRQIRDAQAVRGHQMRSLRDWLPLLMPLLVGGLEHAMQLGEAMTARGFASSRFAGGKETVYPRIFMVLGLVMITAGWLVQLSAATNLGWAFIVLGAAVILGGLWATGRQSPRTTYHRSAWTWKDWLGVAGSIGVLAACLLPIPGLAHETLYYNPYPVLSRPPFDPWLGLSLLGLLVPGLFYRGKKTEEAYPDGVSKKSAW